jgi:hypothetical protein
MRDGLTFDEASHTYRYRGAPIPGVTGILKELIKVEWGNLSFYINTITGQAMAADAVEAAGDYGRAVHKVMELALLHGIDAIFYPEAIESSVRALVQWQADYKPEIVAVEKRVCSTKYGYAGTLDILAYLPMIKRLALVDVKTGIGTLTGPQTSAYEVGFREETGERKLINRYKLRLPKKGEGPYKFTPLDNGSDWDYFQSRLFNHNFHQAL